MRPSYGKAILGGIVGTALITAMMYWVAPMMMGEPMDVAGMVAGMIGTGKMVGWVVHILLGVVVFPLIYAAVLFTLLPGDPWLKGAIWGLILWLLAEIAVVPMAGGGVFHGGMMMPVMGSFLGHLVYGIALGAIAGGGAEPTYGETDTV